jgi:hypothetical protein
MVRRCQVLFPSLVLKMAAEWSNHVSGLPLGEAVAKQIGLVGQASPPSRDSSGERVIAWVLQVRPPSVVCSTTFGRARTEQTPGWGQRTETNDAEG